MYIFYFKQDMSSIDLFLIDTVAEGSTASCNNQMVFGNISLFFWLLRPYKITVTANYEIVLFDRDYFYK